MATDVRIEQTFACSPARIRSALTDVDFLALRATQSGGQNVQVDVSTDANGSTTTVVRRALPAQVPAFARALVSDAIELTEVQVWEPIAAHGMRSAFTATFSAPMSAHGDIHVLSEGESGSRMSTHITLRASVPLISGKLEALVAEQTENYLALTKQLLDAWTASRG